MTSTLFWNIGPRNGMRANDPLGFDALREAMADTMVPVLTGATRAADEYLHTLIGLRWARAYTKSTLDADLYDRGFKIFERAVKQYWYKFCRYRSAGIDVVQKLCDGPRPDVERQILVNQRAAGLLGAYIVSLRAIGLVQKGSLQIEEDKVDSILRDVEFRPEKGWTRSWNALEASVSSLDLRTARKTLGIWLFEEEAGQAMHCAAKSYIGNKSATSWMHVNARALTDDQNRVAAATQSLVELETDAITVFSRLLSGEKEVSRADRRALRGKARRAMAKNPFPPQWKEQNPLRTAMSDAMTVIGEGEDPAIALLQLHKRVTKTIRGNDPWMLRLGETSVFAKRKPDLSGRDFRFNNFARLVKETRWETK